MPRCFFAVLPTLSGYFLDKMLKGEMKRILVIATGALHSQISYQQKQSIPCIAHAIELEVNYAY